MNTNKILITSLVSLSLLFTGFKAETEEYSRVLGNYDDYTYDFVLKEEREDASHKTYTYFEYNFTNIGEGYLLDVTVSSFGWLKAKQKPEGDVFKYVYHFLEPNSSAVYSFNIYDYNDEEITFEGRGFNEVVSGVTCSNFDIGHVGIPCDGDGVYKYSYCFEMDVSYYKEITSEYTEILFVDYKGITYSMFAGQGSNDELRNVWVETKEELDAEQISVHLVVFKEDHPVMDWGFREGHNRNGFIMSIIIAAFIGLSIVGALVYAVILIVNKCKKPKEK